MGRKPSSDDEDVSTSEKKLVISWCFTAFATASRTVLAA